MAETPNGHTAAIRRPAVALLAGLFAAGAALLAALGLGAPSGLRRNRSTLRGTRRLRP